MPEVEVEVEKSINSPSIPTSLNAEREPSTVDGPIDPNQPRTPLAAGGIIDSPNLGIELDKPEALIATSGRVVGSTHQGSVDHPAHYNAHPSGVECIDVVEHMGFNLGNAVKYIWRADEKGNALEDLEKAAWYVRREIARRIGVS